MCAVAFDPSGLQGLLFDLTLIDTLVSQKIKPLSVLVASRDPFKEVRLGGDCKTTRSFQGPATVKQWNITRTMGGENFP